MTSLLRHPRVETGALLATAAGTAALTLVLWGVPETLSDRYATPAWLLWAGWTLIGALALTGAAIAPSCPRRSRRLVAAAAILALALAALPPEGGGLLRLAPALLGVLLLVAAPRLGRGPAPR